MIWQRVPRLARACFINGAVEQQVLRRGRTRAVPHYDANPANTWYLAFSVPLFRPSKGDLCLGPS